MLYCISESLGGKSILKTWHLFVEGSFLPNEFLAGKILCVSCSPLLVSKYFPRKRMRHDDR